MRRISGLLDVGACRIDMTTERIRYRLSARQVSLRHLHRRARHAAAPAGGRLPVSNVQAYAEDVERRAGGQLRHPHSLERRPFDRPVLLGALAQYLPLHGVQGGYACNNIANHAILPSEKHHRLNELSKARYRLPLFDAYGRPLPRSVETTTSSLASTPPVAEPSKTKQVPIQLRLKHWWQQLPPFRQNLITTIGILGTLVTVSVAYLGLRQEVAIDPYLSYDPAD